MTRTLHCMPIRMPDRRPSGTVCLIDPAALHCTCGRVARLRPCPVRLSSSASPARAWRETCLAASLMRGRLVMSDGMRSPRILAVSRGRMEVEGIGAGKDFKLYPGGGRERDWNETGTRHSPGIQPADAEELLAHGATAVVLSRA